MRIDQYLWCMRYFKSRNIASNACKKGQIKINGQVVKASREVLRQDRVEITEGSNQLPNDGLGFSPKSRVGAKLVDIYRMDTTPREAFEQRDIQQSFTRLLSRKRRRTTDQKDRRNLDDFLWDDEKEKD